MANEFKPDVGKKVKKVDSKKWIDDYQKAYPGQTKSVFFGKDAIDAIFSSDSSITGISFFFCRKSVNGSTFNDLVMVGTKLDGKLVWSAGPAGTDSTLMAKSVDDGGVDNSFPCPPACPTDDEEDN